MERKQNRIQSTMAAVGLLVLILDSSQALEGARIGIELCIQTVVPSLFPFFVLSTILTNTSVSVTSYPIRMVAHFLGIPSEASSAFIPAFFGGYPVGAKCIGNLYRAKQIGKQNAERLLAFCNNAGPSFLFGMVSCFFPEKKMIWMLWFIQILSAVFTARTIPALHPESKNAKQDQTFQQDMIILSALKAMAVVCCWVILFRIVLSFLDSWFFGFLPTWLQVFLTGCLELTNGCCQLFLISDLRLRFVLCSCMLAFGGVCVLFQTASVANGLSLGSYIKGKLIQTVFSFLLSVAFISGKSFLIPVCISFLIVFLSQKRKKYSNPQTIAV